MENTPKKENMEIFEQLPENDDIEIFTDELIPLPEPPPEVDETTEAIKAERRTGWFIRDLFEWGETLVSAVIIIVVIFTFFVRVTSVDGLSMQPTLRDEDQMLVTNFFYTPARNDIVVIYAPYLEQGKDIIKRIVGIEGDIIEIKAANYFEENSGYVYRNGEQLTLIENIDGLFEDDHPIGGRTFSQRNVDLRVEVPPGYVFVLGDNRGNSTDSRCDSVGLVNINYIAGKAFFRVAPFDNFGLVD
jgi:signal peptidase I